MTVRAEPDVLVVGAGPTGLTLAAQLHALGAAVRIVDRRLDRVHESRALALQPRTLETLRGLGIAQTLVERGNDTSQLQLHAGERVIVVRLFDVGLEDTAYPFLLFISQAETEAVLNEHLAEHGITVERDVELVDFQADRDRIVCTLRHGDETTERLHARYLVGCDGAHSSVRHSAGIPFERGAYPQTFVLGDLEVDGELEPDVGHAFLGESGMLFFFAAGDNAPRAGRPLARLEQHRRAQPTRTLGRLVDPVDLDVGRPHRSPRAALDDSPAQSRAGVEREVATRGGPNHLRPPLQQTRVKLARPRSIGRVELEVNDRHWGRRHVLCPSAAGSGAARRAASAIAAKAPASESAAAAVIAIAYPSLKSPVVP